MTKALYLDNSYLQTCDAVVLRCTEAATGGYDIVLDQTVLYPTGGGQPHDTGRIGGIAVTDVFEHEGTIVHHAAQPLAEGQAVRVEVDWPRRFDHMQQHCGEHLFSFAAKELFGAVNVGFHMADTYCTVDLDAQLSEEQIAKIEARANALIWADLPVDIRYVTADELAGMDLRKKAEGLAGSIRIVSMPGGDSCTCCGTHAARTGEVGALKITAAMHYKGGERITFNCGGRALLHAQAQQRIVDTLARRYSCGAEDVIAAVTKQQQELATAKKDCRQLYAKLLPYLQNELLQATEEHKGAWLIVEKMDIDAQQLRPLALSLCEGRPALVLLLAPSGESAQYVLCRSEKLQLDIGELAQAVNAALNARGGGRGTLAQGSAPGSAALPEPLAQLKGYLGKRLDHR